MFLIKIQIFASIAIVREYDSIGPIPCCNVALFLQGEFHSASIVEAKKIEFSRTRRTRPRCIAIFWYPRQRTIDKRIFIRQRIFQTIQFQNVFSRDGICYIFSFLFLKTKINHKRNKNPEKWTHYPWIIFQSSNDFHSLIIDDRSKVGWQILSCSAM